jgi:hypothetical protein
MLRFEFKPTVSRNLIMGMFIGAILTVTLLYSFRETLQQIYFHNQVTPIGLALNGIIIALFLAGMLRLAALLRRYWREEVAIADFLEYIRHEQQDSDAVRPDINAESIIARRYVSMAIAQKQGTTPNHAALSQVLLANESIRGSLTKYVNNILILIGVFGTVVSLSIALYGTSNLIDASANISTSDSSEGINLVIHGMSTALSTTITAIVCYLIFGYFYLRLNSVKVRVISAVEQITADYLLPKFKVKSENISAELALLIEALGEVTQGMIEAQNRMQGDQDIIRKAMQDHDNRMSEMAVRLVNLQHILSRGFRLEEKEN